MSEKQILTLKEKILKQRCEKTSERQTRAVENTTEMSRFAILEESVSIQCNRIELIEKDLEEIIDLTLQLDELKEEIKEMKKNLLQPSNKQSSGNKYI